MSKKSYPSTDVQKVKAVREVTDLMNCGVLFRKACAECGYKYYDIMRWKKLHCVEKDQAAFEAARMVAVEGLAEEILEIGDEPVEHVERVETPEGIRVTYKDSVAHRKLQCENRRWYLSKVMPKKFGDKVTLSGDEENPLRITAITRKIIAPKDGS